MPRFKNYTKKLARPFQQVVLDAAEEIASNPEIGERKKGDLESFRVYKFMMNRQLTLIAYKLERDSIILYQIGPHENIYSKLKKYVKEIGV